MHILSAHIIIIIIIIIISSSSSSSSSSSIIHYHLYAGNLQSHTWNKLCS
jgi:hypothetical protein